MPHDSLDYHITWNLSYKGWKKSAVSVCDSSSLQIQHEFQTISKNNYINWIRFEYEIWRHKLFEKLTMCSIQDFSCCSSNCDTQTECI